LKEIIERLLTEAHANRLSNLEENQRLCRAEPSHGDAKDEETGLTILNVEGDIDLLHDGNRLIAYENGALTEPRSDADIPDQPVTDFERRAIAAFREVMSQPQ
jgi:hypothetical protein